jgi:transposase InsO family protein
MRYAFIRQQSKAYPITVLCRVMRVCRSCFYEYLKHCKTSKRDLQQEELESRIKAIFLASGKTYGSRRIAKDLRNEGRQIGRYRARSLMKKLGLKVKFKKRYIVTTDSNHFYQVAPNLLDRKFDVDQPNLVWASDITYIRTGEGWLYLAIVMDLYSRQIVGWNMDKTTKAVLACDALMMAIKRRSPGAGVMHHSDRGIQYACDQYQELLEKYQFKVSMSRKGDCWDNAPVERFFRSLKSERLAFQRFPSRQAARLEALDYITYYNTDRIHSYLGYLSPMKFERNSMSAVA